jgi:hypothetical protein
MRHPAWVPAVLVAALAAFACTNAGESRVSGLDASGTVSGRALVDANGSGVVDSGDVALPNVRVQLVLPRGAVTGLTATTHSDGAFQFTDVPVGQYALQLDTTTFGDTLQVVAVDSASFTVAPAESVTVNILAGRPSVTIAQARALPAGRKVFVTGVALNSSASFVDTVVFLQDSSAAIRLTRLRSPVVAGDSLRALGTTSTRDGLPTLDDVRIFALGTGLMPAAPSLTVGQMRTASGGTLDAALAQVDSVTIADTSTVSEGFALTVSDGTNSGTVTLDRTADSAFRATALPGSYVPGNRFNVFGVLAPQAAGIWQLKPRTAADLAALPLPVISIRSARALPVGSIAQIVGVALNGSTTFADSSVFLADTSGAIRATRLRGTVVAGDSVRVRGNIGTRSGQPTLDGGTTTALGQGFYPSVATLTTATAAAASGGTRDAQLVIVPGATITDTSRTTSSFLLTMNDGSGALVVQLDGTADPAFQSANLPGVYVPGNKFDLLGILVPTGTGTWRLRPRSASDLTQIQLPVMSIQAARALPSGQTAVVVGVALNSTSMFSDTSVFVEDTSGAIRLTRLRTTVTVGDSLRIQGTTSSRSGQPTIDGATATKLGTGFVPSLPSLATAQAASAAGGTRDAQLVTVPNASISDTSTVLQNYQMTVTDGTGNLTVVIDRATGIVVPSTYLPGNVFNLVGILVPTGTGTWVLRPRTAADLVKH